MHYAILVRSGSIWATYTIAQNKEAAMKALNEIVDRLIDNKSPINNYRMLELPNKPMFNGE